MPAFGSASLRQMHTLDSRLKSILNEAIEIFDFTIICGHRSEHAQNEAFNNGKSKLRWPQSRHNTLPSLAVDIAPYYRTEPHIRWNRLYEFVYLHGIIYAVAARQGIIIRSGINWDQDDELITDQKFNDFPHIELV